MDKPRIFLGSSGKQEKLLQALTRGLGDIANVEPWTTVFNPGVSGKEGGLGLGLWLAETFIHQFEGQITFTSSGAKGTTFVVTLQPMNI